MKCEITIALSDWLTMERLYSSTIEDLLLRIDTIIFDCDGVIWRGEEAIQGASEAIESLRSRGKRLFFITNNSSSTRHELVTKFLGFGLQVQPVNAHT